MIFGCGYVGRALAQRLLQAGVRVGALTRNADKAAELKALGLQEVVVADLDSDAWHDALSGTYGAVVNCVSSAGGGACGLPSFVCRGAGIHFTLGSNTGAERIRLYQ